MLIAREPFKLSGRKVVRFFPKPVRHTMPDHTTLIFQAGVQEIPEELADSQWLKDNGVSEHKLGDALPPLMRKAPPGSQAAAAALASSGVYDAVHAPRQHSEIDPVGEADQADAEVAALEIRLETARDRAAALRGVSDKHLARQADIDRSKGVEANTGEEDAEVATKDGVARPKDGDTNPKTGNPFTAAALEKAQSAWDEAPEDEEDDDNGDDN